MMESEAYTLRSEVKQLRNDVDASSLALKQTREKLNKTEQDLKAAQKASDEKESRIVDLREEMNLERERFHVQMKSELSVMKQQNTIVFQQKEQLEVEIEDNDTALQKLRREAIVAEERTKREFQTSLNELVLQNAKLEKATVALKNELTITKAESEGSIMNLKQAIEMRSHEADVMTKERISLNSENELMEEMTKGLKEQLLETQNKLEITVDECNRKQREIEESRNNLKLIAAQNEAVSSQLELQTRELMKEKRSTERAEQETKDTEKRSKKDKKKAEAYKQKALEAHAKTLHAKQLLRSMPK